MFSDVPGPWESTAKFGANFEKTRSSVEELPTRCLQKSILLQKNLIFLQPVKRGMQEPGGVDFEY